MPPPKPPLPAAISNNNSSSNITPDPANNEAVKQVAAVKDEVEKRKPDWLEELSRKQAHRKSGMFSDSKSESSVISSSAAAPTVAPTAAPAPTAATKPAVVTDKPHLPVKPSQIRDEGKSTDN